MFVLDTLILLTGVLLLLGIASSKFSARLGVPMLVMFLALGMLAGSEGIGGIEFENYSLAHGIGTVALGLILFDGGLRTPYRSIRAAWKPAGVLATAGVFLTAAITGLALARSNLERNVSTLHRAGADFVLSYAAIGATGLFNLLKRSDVLLVAEGLHAFRLATPGSLQGRSLAESYIRRDTGCNVIAVFEDGAMDSNPDPNRELPHGSELLLIGDAESEKRFHDVFI